ncbi:hypothetical protein POV27_01560 [Aureisphaera galaxeae]|uniref:hypothetical protein n=1 Tax=Aureisphaera galaxeae TaxID=1538023 RepID=UPI00234FF6E0|nr:hypothetical protein [Aureisphaera galaxeae]MDC8002726.1 hypothetical protein [Aureisphaera galaxeae]
MEYYKRDLGYIELIAETFVNHLKVKKVRKMDDRIALYFDPEPKNLKINKISKSLKFHITRANASMDLLDEITPAYVSKSKEIYELSIKDRDYIGSDTWGFFKNNVRDFCIENDSRNILIILTDGYMFHKNNLREKDHLTTYLTPQYVKSENLNSINWKAKMDQKNYGFLVAENDLSNLDVLVLGINPIEGNVYEDDLIKEYWQKWFREMKVNYYEVRNAELPSNMKKIISDFIIKH